MKINLPENHASLTKEEILKMIYLVSGWIEEKKTHNEITVIALNKLAIEIHDHD